MTFAEFDKFQDALYNEILHIGNTKGKEYASSEDRFANFKRAAASKGVSPLVVAGIFLDKHLDSINSFIKSGGDTTNLSEPIRGRFKDAILYLILMAGIQEEEALGKDDTKLSALRPGHCASQPTGHCDGRYPSPPKGYSDNKPTEQLSFDFNPIKYQDISTNKLPDYEITSVTPFTVHEVIPSEEYNKLMQASRPSGYIVPPKKD